MGKKELEKEMTRHVWKDIGNRRWNGWQVDWKTHILRQKMNFLEVGLCLFGRSSFSLFIFFLLYVSRKKIEPNLQRYNDSRNFAGKLLFVMSKFFLPVEKRFANNKIAEKPHEILTFCTLSVIFHTGSLETTFYVSTESSEQQKFCWKAWEPFISVKFVEIVFDRRDLNGFLPV